MKKLVALILTLMSGSVMAFWNPPLGPYCQKKCIGRNPMTGKCIMLVPDCPEEWQLSQIREAQSMVASVRENLGVTDYDDRLNSLKYEAIDCILDLQDLDWKCIRRLDDQLDELIWEVRL